MLGRSARTRRRTAALLGGVLLGVAETFAAAYISSEYKDIVAFGLLVLGSPDAQRFDATMGTDFLGRMAELASAALARLR